MNNLRKTDILGTVAWVATAPFVQERFCYSLAEMVSYNTTHLETENKKIYYDHQQMSWLPRGRNDIVKSMRGDWVFMLDADMEFEPDCLSEMLKIMNKYNAPVVTGLYVHKKKPYFPVLYSHNTKRKVYEIIAKWDGNPDIFQVDASGAGCLLIKKFVFNLIWNKLNEDPFDVIAKLGEDFSFFDRLSRVGVGVYCAPKIKFTHLGIQGYNYNPDYNKRILTKGYIR